MFANGDISVYVIGLRCSKKDLPWVATAVYSNSSQLRGTFNQLTMKRYFWQHPQNQDFCMKPEHAHIHIYIYIVYMTSVHTEIY